MGSGAARICDKVRRIGSIAADGKAFALNRTFVAHVEHRPFRMANENA